METPAPRAPLYGLFFAVLPDAAAADRILRLASQLRAAHRLRGKPFPAERLHVTLDFFGPYVEIPAGLIETAVDAAGSVVAAPCGIGLDRAMSFSGRTGHHPFVLLAGEGTEALSGLRRALAVAMAKRRFAAPAGHSFSPHVTLLYDARRVPENPILPIHWTAEEFVLIRSHMGLGRHEVLGRWPLRGPAA